MLVRSLFREELLLALLFLLIASTAAATPGTVAILFGSARQIFLVPSEDATLSVTFGFPLADGALLAFRALPFQTLLLLRMRKGEGEGEGLFLLEIGVPGVRADFCHRPAQGIICLCVGDCGFGALGLEDPVQFTDTGHDFSPYLWLAIRAR